MALFRGRQGMGVAALIMGMSVLLSRFMGLVRDKVISYLFGATTESDLYFAAFVIPDFINYLLAGAYFSITLIPLLAAYFETDEDEGWRFFSAVLNWITISIGVLTALTMWLAEDFARLAAPGLPPDNLPRLAFFLRIVVPAQVFFLLGSCYTAVLYLRKQFVIPALTPIIYNGLIILGGLMMRQRGMEGFCWGVLAGAMLGNFLLPALAVQRAGQMKWYPILRHSSLKRFVILALPLMIGQSIVVLDEQLVRIFGSMAGHGAISWLNYARRIMLVPVGVVAQAAGVASFPFLAQLLAQGELKRFNETLKKALESVMILLIPISVWMMIVAGPTITLIFQQGQFSVSDTEQTTILLRVALSMVLCWGFQQVVGRAYYARQDTLTPAIIGTLATVVSIPLYYGLTLRYRALGVGTASALSILLYTISLMVWWGHKFGFAAFSGLLLTGGRVMGITLLCAIPSYFAMRPQVFDPLASPYKAAFWELGASGLAFGVCFLFFAMLWVSELLAPILRKAGPLGRWVLGFAPHTDAGRD